MIYTFWKVGDQVTAPGLEYKGFRDGMLVSYQPDTVEPGKMDKKAYAILKVPDSWLPLLREKTKWVGADMDMILTVKAEDFRRSQLCIDFATVAASLSEPLIVDEWRGHGVSVEPVDATELSSSVLKDSTKVVFDKAVEDLNQTTSGSFTVGSGGDWAEWTNVFGDMGNFTGNITLTQISDIAISGGALSTVDMNGYKLTITSASKHYGNPNLGYKTTSDGNYVILGLGFNDTSGASTIEISWLYLKSLSVNYYEGISCVYGITSGWELYLHDCIGDGNGYAYTSSAKFFRHNIPGTIVKNYIWNCKVWDFYWGLQWSDGGANGYLQNNVVYNNIAVGVNGYSRVAEVKNCLLHHRSGGSCTDVTQANISYSAATDTTIGSGSGKFQSITFADWVGSTDDSSAEFLKINTSNVNANEGGTNSGLFSGNTKGIEENARPHESTKVSINAHEFGGQPFALRGLDVPFVKSNSWRNSPGLL